MILLLLASVAYIVVASVLDALFGWGIVDATRGFVPGSAGDPGDCDPRYGSC